MASKIYLPAAAFAADIDREKRSVLLLFSISFAKTLFVMNERCCKRLDFFKSNVYVVWEDIYLVYTIFNYVSFDFELPLIVTLSFNFFGMTIALQVILDFVLGLNGLGWTSTELEIQTMPVWLF